MSAIRLYAPVQPGAIGGPVVPPTNANSNPANAESSHRFSLWFRRRGKTRSRSARNEERSHAMGSGRNG